MTDHVPSHADLAAARDRAIQGMSNYLGAGYTSVHPQDVIDLLALPASTEQSSPLCRDKATRPDGSTITCAKFADHVSPWHRRGNDSWRNITKFGTGKGTSPRTPATQG